jgi:hypothetical protein
MTWTKDDLQKIIDCAYDDVKTQLFYAIENLPDERPVLLNQLDVLTKVKERLNARLGYNNPASNG